MIDAITRIGALTLAESLPEGLDRYEDLSRAEQEALGTLVEPPGADQVVVLVFERDTPKFRGHHLEDCRNDEPLRYLYRSGPPNGPLALPYGQITERLKEKERTSGALVKTVTNRLVGWATAIQKEGAHYIGPLNAHEIAWLRALAREIETRQRDLSSVVDRIQMKTPAKTKLFLTLAFAGDATDLHLGHPTLPFARLFLARGRARMFGGEEQTGTCSLCGQEAVVSPKFGSDIFPFATFDQPAYVAGGLDRKGAWRSFSICDTCYRQADRGRRYTEQNLARRIGFGPSALSYWAVPSLLNPNTGSEAAGGVVDLLRRQKGTGKNLSKTERKVLLTNEEDLLYELKDLSDYAAFSLIFVEKLKARERILLTVEDVLPSRLRRLFDAKSDVEKLARERGYLREEWEFTLARHLFPLCEVDHGGGNTDLRRPEFLAILDHIFRGVPLAASYLANTFVGPLRARFVAWRGERADDEENRRRFRDAARAAWLTWDFLSSLDVISEEGELTHMSVPSPTEARPSGSYFEWLEDFFARSPRTFQSDAARVAFLLGGLSDSVREVQLEHLGAAPFVKHLKSLRMEQRDLLGLLPKITQKLTEYDAYRGRSRQVLEAVSFYLSRAGIETWPFTSDEINLIFAMGMNLAFVIRRGPGKADDADTDLATNNPTDDPGASPN